MREHVVIDGCYSLVSDVLFGLSMGGGEAEMKEIDSVDWCVLYT